MSKVSVIISAHNRGHFLSAVIESVLRQTFRDFELIIVDDASKDHTEKVVRGFRDERVRYIRHAINRGEAARRNTGLMHNRSESGAFLNDNDECLTEKLQLQVDLLERSQAKVGGVYAGFLAIEKASGETLGRWIPKKRGNIYRDMANGNFVGSLSTVLLKRECFEKVGLFDEKIAYGLAYDMCQFLCQVHSERASPPFPVPPFGRYSSP